LKGQTNPEGRMVIDNPKPGDHTLQISLAGKRNHEQKVTVMAGQATKITAVLADLAGTVVVQSSPGAVVSLDDSSRGTVDAAGQLSIPDVSAGSHVLRISSSGKKDYQQQITVPAGQEARIKAPLRTWPEPWWSRLRRGLRFSWTIPAGAPRTLMDNYPSPR
jgi:hypothetical protein